MSHNLPIITVKLIIRKWEATEFEAYNVFCQESLRGDFFPGWAMQEPEARAFFAWQRSKYERMDPVNDVIGLAIEEIGTGTIVGHGGIAKHDDLGETEIFYGILKAYRGRGYATEASKAITRWALQTFPLPYLIATVGVDNIASQKVIERSGYRFIEERTLHVSQVGQSFQFRYYRITREDL